MRFLSSLVLTGCATVAQPAGTAQEQAVEEKAPYDVDEAGDDHFEQLNVVVGLRDFEDSGWDPVQGQGLVGLDFAQGIHLGDLWLEGGLQYSFDRDDAVVGGTKTTIDTSNWEVSAGFVYGVQLERWRPYAGLGGAFLFVDLDHVESGLVVHDGDTVLGAYGKVGILFAVSGHSHFGFEYRHFEGEDVSIAGGDIGSASDSFGLVFGARF